MTLNFKHLRFALLFYAVMFAAFLACVLYFGYDRYQGNCVDEREAALDTLINQYSTRYGVDSLLVKALIWKESRFCTNARGKDNDLGLMQVLRSTSGADFARRFKQDNPPEMLYLTPEINLNIGTWYLSEQLKSKKFTPYIYVEALSAYNAGPTKAREWFKTADVKKPWVSIAYPSTRQYVRDILKRYVYYQKRDGRAKIIDGGLSEGI